MSAVLFPNGDVVTQYMGQIVRASGGSAVLALADSPANAEKLIGVRLSDVAAAASGFIAAYVPGMKVRCEAEPTQGNELWLSATNPGDAAIAAPATAVLLGVCYAKTQIGGVWYADVIPEVLANGSGGGIFLNAKGDIPSHDGTIAQIVTLGVSEGMVPTVDSLAPCGWYWQTPSKGGLQTVYDKDLSTLATSANFVNGPNIIDGYTWTGENMANATQFKLVNGSGLVMQCNTTASRVSDRTAPLITIPLNSYSISLTEGSVKEILSWFMFTNNQSASSDSSFFAYETNPYDAIHVTRIGLLRGNFGGGAGTPGFVTEGVEDATRTTVSDSTNPTRDVIMLRWMNMTYGEVYSGQSVAGAWPSLSSLQFRGFFRSPSSALVAFNPNLNGRNIGLLVSSFSFNTNGTFITTLQKMRIQASITI